MKIIGKKEINDNNDYIHNQLNPVFGKTFELPALLPLNHTLKITVLDWDQILADDLINLENPPSTLRISSWVGTMPPVVSQRVSPSEWPNWSWCPYDVILCDVVPHTWDQVKSDYRAHVIQNLKNQFDFCSYRHKEIIICGHFGAAVDSIKVASYLVWCHCDVINWTVQPFSVAWCCCAYTLLCTHTCTHVHTRAHMHTHAHTHTHTYTHMHIHTHTHTHTLLHPCTNAPSHLTLSPHPHKHT